jgi:hypothetical protein
MRTVQNAAAGSAPVGPWTRRRGGSAKTAGRRTASVTQTSGRGSESCAAAPGPSRSRSSHTPSWMSRPGGVTGRRDAEETKVGLARRMRAVREGRAMRWEQLRAGGRRCCSFEDEAVPYLGGALHFSARHDGALDAESQKRVCVARRWAVRPLWRSLVQQESSVAGGVRPGRMLAAALHGDEADHGSQLGLARHTGRRRAQERRRRAQRKAPGCGVRVWRAQLQQRLRGARAAGSRQRRRGARRGGERAGAAAVADEAVLGGRSEGLWRCKIAARAAAARRLARRERAPQRRRAASGTSGQAPPPRAKEEAARCRACACGSIISRPGDRRACDGGTTASQPLRRRPHTPSFPSSHQDCTGSPAKKACGTGLKICSGAAQTEPAAAGADIDLPQQAP